MKTRKELIEKNVSAYRTQLKLRVVEHRDLPNAVNSFMIFSGTESNPTAFICGGNIRSYVPAKEMTKLCYPTVFKSRKSARDHLIIDIWARHCIDNRIADLEFALEG